MPDKILVIDDEPDILRIVSYSLQKWGYEVITATNGREGLDKIADEKPDLIVLDAGMPTMNGFEMLEELHKDSAYTDIPVIMLTAHTDTRSIDLARGHDIFEYITKPFNPVELREKINKVLSHSK